MFGLNFGIRSRWVILAVLGSFLVSLSAVAQLPVPIVKGVTQIQISNANTRLTGIERQFSQIEKKKVVTAEDSEAISQATLSYAEAMKTALDNALKNAETLAKTQGRQGSINPLDTFEKAEKANQPRLQRLQERANAVDNQIKSGNIRIDKPIIQKLSIPERRELIDSLEVPARQIYIQKQPELFKPALELQAPQKSLKSLNEESLEYQSLMPKNTQNTVANYYVGTTVSEILQNVSNILMPPAYAVAAAPCVKLAITKNWTALATCVVNAGGQATSIYNQFVDCWKRASGFFKWLKRVGCVAKLIIKLA
jgi:hypothetical protein